MSQTVPPDRPPSSEAPTATGPTETAGRPRRGLSVDWAAVLVAGVLVLLVATGLLPGIGW